MRLFALALLLIVFNAQAIQHWSLPANTNHLSKYFDVAINKGRIQVYSLKEGVNLQSLPQSLRKIMKPIDLQRQLPVRTELKFFRTRPRQDVLDLINKLKVEDFQKTLEWVTDFGKRSTPASRQGILDKLNEYGYQAVEDYNIEAFKKGMVEPDKLVILEAHMDTVRNTMGADDNGSGTAALLEAARILRDVSTKYSILFLVTEDEEKGLLGSRYKVKKLKENNLLNDIVFVANMDMISYREIDRFDIETEPEFEDLAKWVARIAKTYISMEPNILLNAWGADHVPFLDEGVPTVLTIEHWNNHNPCYHKSCDNLTLVDWDYATEIARLNIAMVALKAQILD